MNLDRQKYVFLLIYQTTMEKYFIKHYFCKLIIHEMTFIEILLIGANMIHEAIWGKDEEKSCLGVDF